MLRKWKLSFVILDGNRGRVDGRGSEREVAPVFLIAI
jgi:hypothetical protein